MNRIALLNKLINLEESVDVLTEKLDKFGWDSLDDLVLIKKEHLLKVINYYLNGKLNKLEIENWANAIESREDLGFESCAEDTVREVIDELANPYLTEDLTVDRAKILQKNLMKECKSSDG